MKQARFLGALAETGSVRAAAARVGMSRETAYRLRGKPGAGNFADAWNRALGRRTGQPRKVTLEELRQRVFVGLLKPLMYCGRHVSTARKADNSALFRLLAQLDRSSFASDAGGPCPRRFTPRSASTGAAG